MWCPGRVGLGPGPLRSPRGVSPVPPARARSCPPSGAEGGSPWRAPRGCVWGGFLCPFSHPHPLHRVPVGPSAPPGSALQSSARVMCSRTVPHKAPRIPGPAPAPCPRRTGARPPRAAPAHLSRSEPPARRSYGRS